MVAANAQVTAAILAAVEVMGVDVAASVLDLSKAEVRRMTKKSE